jgi:peroxiredoxin Q/BCP
MPDTTIKNRPHHIESRPHLARRTDSTHIDQRNVAMEANMSNKESKTAQKITEGMTAPDFELENTDGRIMKLSNLKGKWVVLYFYPKDFTPGCTVEATSFQHIAEDFRRENAEIIGISTDTAARHCNFQAKLNLSFPLLADPERIAIEAYGSWKPKSMFGKTFLGTRRSTYLIDPEGVIRHVWPDVKVVGHAEKVLATIKGLGQK